MSLFELVVNIWGWIKIVGSPFLIGVAISSVIYLKNGTTENAVLGIIISLLGLIIGIVWATTIWKKQGTSDFLAEEYKTPDLDKNFSDSQTKTPSSKKSDTKRKNRCNLHE